MNISDYVTQVSRQVDGLKLFAVSAAVGDALECLLIKHKTIIIHASDDLDDFAVSVADGAKQLSVTGPTLIDAMKACGTRKACSKCGAELPLIAYSKDSAKPYGHASCCKDCEKARLKEFYRRRSAQDKRRNGTDRGHAAPPASTSQNTVPE